MSDPAGGSTRWELLRALGAIATLDAASSDPLCDALDLPRWDPAEHTGLFVLGLVPYASVYLGAEGGLGGDAAEAVAGIWRALGLQPPSEPDHLGSLLGLYAELGEAGEVCATDAARRRLAHARTTVLFEHLWSWVPGYLRAAAGLPGGGPWASLLLTALAEEAAVALGAGPPPGLPAALRDAPGPIDPEGSVGDLLDAVVAPVRAGFVLTRADLVAAGRQAGIGVRLGERRYALRAMLDQDGDATLAWLADHARRWETAHRRQVPDTLSGRWWAERAATSAAVLGSLAPAAPSVR